MRNHDQEFLCILAAIVLHASGVPAAAVDNAEAIIRIVRERYPDTIEDMTDLRSKS